jgi:ribonuclease P protein component
LIGQAALFCQIYRGYHEAHLSAQQSCACPSARLPYPVCHCGWPQGAGCSPRTRPQEAICLNQAARLSVLSRRADFLAANRGLRVARPGFVLLVHPNSAEAMRFGITVTKRIGNAVVRNRMKRRFRELLRELLPEAGLAAHDHVLIGREGGIERDFARLREELAAALTRAAQGKGDPPRKRR